MDPSVTRSDEELIADYLAGDEAAFGMLTARHLGGVYTFALRLVGDSAAAEDIAQETFLKAWKSLKKYDERSSKFKTWMLRIARNTAIDYLRKKKHVPLSAFDNESGSNVLAETVAADEELAPQALERLDDARELHAVLELLPPKHREILLLYYSSDHTFEEIALMLEEPANTVKSRHRRALAALREIIAPNHY
jgi:RNA polymerase sigma factor (sigma-70 family)